ncbi:hypothetical protein [Streptomyces sp. NPDC047990]|uniref:hypothetical protein n=1 Tax=Streptomyces sp. NPDC047990 TaxID=3365496 RepID=UPI003718AC46
MTTAVETSVPVTYEGERPEDLIGRLVLARPYYHVPQNRSSLARARSPWVFEAYVTETFGLEMVLLKWAWDTSHPWMQQSVFYPKELHQPYGVCACPACISQGAGIHELDGA